MLSALSAFQPLAEEPVPDACQGNFPLGSGFLASPVPEPPQQPENQCFCSVPLCPRLEGREFRAGQLGCRFAAPVMFVTLL